MAVLRVIIDGKEKWKWGKDGIPRDTVTKAMKDGQPKPIKKVKDEIIDRDDD